MLDNLLALLKARLHNIQLGITTGNWDPAINDFKQNFQEYKHLYIALTIIIIIYVVLEVYYPDYNWKLINTKQNKYKNKQSGGSGTNNIQPNARPPPEQMNATQPTSKLTKSQIASAASGVQSAGGLCSGDGFFAKICQGAGSGIMGVLKFIGMIFLGVLLLLAPPLIYIMLVYIVLKLMFKGLQGV